VEALGIESASTPERSVVKSGEEQLENAPQGDAKRPEVSVSAAPAEGDTSGADPVELALAKALVQAADASRLDVVAQIVKELEARRHARARNVVTFDPERRKGSA
jgi:hypothetical protein